MLDPRSSFFHRVLIKWFGCVRGGFVILRIDRAGKGRDGGQSSNGVSRGDK